MLLGVVCLVSDGWLRFTVWFRSCGFGLLLGGCACICLCGLCYLCLLFCFVVMVGFYCLLGLVWIVLGGFLFGCTAFGLLLCFGFERGVDFVLIEFVAWLLLLVGVVYGYLVYFVA